ncbi:MAG: magnesium transporter [Methylovulum sp.]|uniref:magnesium transporter n=1 Tax=Methylovulum sp. TaxID=1916980 RepID=UPI00260FA4DE|nr:magnesium transporter [Methylovulum sp.]MDD2723868.1 magnesium transporter [Methylovulum sp.]MDD5125204.1 magnesium transporter [Methylovulum sp.]
MEASEKLHTAQFLQHQLQEVTTLLAKQQLEKSLVQRGPATNHELVETVLHKQHQTRLQEKFSLLHPADIALILESLPLDQRKTVWDAIKTNHDGQVLLEVSDAVRQTLISGMAAEELASVAGNLDADEIADLAADLPKRAMLRILRSLNSTERTHLNAILSYQDNQVGALMDFGMITIRDDMSLKAISSYIRKLGKLPGHTDKLFVVDQHNQVKGILPLQRLLTHSSSLHVAEVMVTDFVVFQTDQDTSEASRAFERYDLISAPVVDKNGELQGRLCVDSIMDYIREKSDEDLLSQAGVTEEEDLFSSVWKSAKNRWGWLLINIITAFASTRIIGLFENVILQLVALASLMPIVAAMGGNTGNQTSMLIIRSLALGQITPANVQRLIKKELTLALLNGSLIGLIMGLLGFLLYRDIALAGVMATAMFINLLVAVMVGLSIPLVRHKFGKDPAVGTSVILTSITDSMGFFIVLGLANLFLLGK